MLLKYDSFRSLNVHLIKYVTESRYALIKIPHIKEKTVNLTILKV